MNMLTNPFLGLMKQVRTDNGNRTSILKDPQNHHKHRKYPRKKLLVCFHPPRIDKSTPPILNRKRKRNDDHEEENGLRNVDSMIRVTLFQRTSGGLEKLDSSTMVRSPTTGALRAGPELNSSESTTGYASPERNDMTHRKINGTHTIFSVLSDDPETFLFGKRNVVETMVSREAQTAMRQWERHGDWVRHQRRFAVVCDDDTVGEFPMGSFAVERWNSVDSFVDSDIWPALALGDPLMDHGGVGLPSTSFRGTAAFKEVVHIQTDALESDQPFYNAERSPSLIRSPARSPSIPPPSSRSRFLALELDRDDHHDLLQLIECDDEILSLPQLSLYLSPPPPRISVEGDHETPPLVEDEDERVVCTQVQEIQPRARSPVENIPAPARSSYSEFSAPARPLFTQKKAIPGPFFAAKPPVELDEVHNYIGQGSMHSLPLFHSNPLSTSRESRLEPKRTALMPGEESMHSLPLFNSRLGVSAHRPTKSAPDSLNRLGTTEDQFNTKTTGGNGYFSGSSDQHNGEGLMGETMGVYMNSLWNNPVPSMGDESNDDLELLDDDEDDQLQTDEKVADVAKVEAPKAVAGRLDYLLDQSFGTTDTQPFPSHEAVDRSTTSELSNKQSSAFQISQLRRRGRSSLGNDETVDPTENAKGSSKAHRSASRTTQGSESHQSLGLQRRAFEQSAPKPIVPEPPETHGSIHSLQLFEPPPQPNLNEPHLAAPESLLPLGHSCPDITRTELEFTPLVHMKPQKPPTRNNILAIVMDIDTPRTITIRKATSKNYGKQMEMASLFVSDVTLARGAWRRRKGRSDSLIVERDGWFQVVLWRERTRWAEEAVIGDVLHVTDVKVDVHDGRINGITTFDSECALIHATKREAETSLHLLGPKSRLHIRETVGVAGHALLYAPNFVRTALSHDALSFAAEDAARLRPVITRKCDLVPNRIVNIVMKLVEMDRLESLGGFRVILVDEDCQRIGFNIRSPAKEKEQLVAPLTELLGECVALSNVKVVSCSRGRPDVCPLSEPEASDVILETMGTTFVNVAREELIPQTALRNPPPTSIPTIVEFPSISSFLNDKSHHPIAKIQAVITHVHVPSLEWTLSPTLPLETQINAFLLHHATHLSTFAFIYCKGCNERCDPDRNGIRSCPNRAECSRAGKLKLVPTFDKIVLGLSDPILSEEQGNVEMNTVERAFFQSSHGLWDASLRESLGAAAGQSSPRLMGGNAGVMEISVGYRVVEAFLALDGVVSVTPGEVLALSENGNEVASVCGRLVTVFWKACRFGEAEELSRVQNLLIERSTLQEQNYYLRV